MKNAKSIAVVMVALVTCPIAAAVAEFGGSVFTYQGQLKEAGQPFNGPADVTFRLLDAEMGGVQIDTDVAPLDLDIVITRGHVDEAEPLLREGVAIRTAIFG